jgi:hypothetical protein
MDLTSLKNVRYRISRLWELSGEFSNDDQAVATMRGLEFTRILNNLKGVEAARENGYFPRDPGGTVISLERVMLSSLVSLVAFTGRALSNLIRA